MKRQWPINLALALAVTALLIVLTAAAVGAFMRLSLWVGSFGFRTPATAGAAMVLLAFVWVMTRGSRRWRRTSREVARTILAERLEGLKTLSYGTLLARRGETAHDCVAGADGREYQVETTVAWDSPKRQDRLRVMVSVDGGAVSALRPFDGAFIIAPDGSLPGE